MRIDELYITKENRDPNDVWIFLDDERYPPDDGKNWIIMRTADEVIDYVKRNGLPVGFSFDHDLGEGKSGYDAAYEIARMIFEGEIDYKPFEWRVHSMNPVGRDRIKGVFAMIDRHFKNK